MHQNEILTLLHKVVAENQQYTTWTVSTPHLVALVNQAIEAEREACAKVAQKTVCDTHIPTGVRIYGTAAAKAIRARGQL